jgi:DNA-binding NtrC family response regulator
MKILIIEDEPIIAFDLENLVLDNGFEIAGSARTGIEAMFLAPKADIALVDVQLADGATGPIIARQLIDRYGIEVIFMTGNPEMVANFVGAVGVVTKPHSLEKVEAALLKGLSILQSRRRARTS